MTPLQRWIRGKLEKWAGNFYEGPQPPDRLDAIVLAFVDTYPNATRRQWIDFAREHAREAYRAGYMRGFEYTERDPEGWRPDLPPELLADMIDPSWRWTPMDSGIEQVEDAPVEDVPDEVRRIIEEMKRTVQRWTTRR